MTRSEAASLEALFDAPDTERVEARGAWCPVPLTRLQAAVANVAPGAVLALVADDPVVEIDVSAWCIGTGHAYLGTLRADGYLVAMVRRRTGA